MQGRKGTFSEEIFFDSMLKSAGDMIETLTSITQALDSYVNNASILSIICTIKDHSLKEKAMNYYNRSISKIQNIACFYSSFLFFYNKSLFQNNNLNLKDLKVSHIIEIGVSLEKMVEIYNQLSEKSLLKKNLAPMIQDVLKVSGILERLVTLLRPVLHNDKTIAENIVLLKEEKLKNDVFNYCAFYNQEVKKLVTRYPYFHTSFYESCKNISMMEPEKITFNTLNQWKLALISHQENFEKIHRNERSLKFDTHNIVELEKLLQERKLKELEKIQRNRHSLKFDTHNIVELKKLLQARDQKEKVASTVEYKDLAEEHTRHELIGEVQYEYEHDEETNRHRKIRATRKCKHCRKEVEIELTEEEKEWKACLYGEEKTDSEGNKYQECSVCGHKKYEKEECKQHGELENIQRSRHLLTFDKQKIFSNIFELKKLLKCKLKELKKLLQARDQKEKVASTVEYKDLAEEHTRHELIGEVQYEYEHDEETNRHRKIRATRKCKHCRKEVEIELTEEEKEWKACLYGEEKTDSEGNKYQECSVCGHKKYVKEECKHGKLENITQKVIWNKDTKTHNIIRKNDNDPWYENENIFFDEPTFRAYIEKPNKISESDFNFIENFSNFQQTEDYEFCKNIEYPFTTKDCLLSQRLKDNLNENWILWRTEDLFNALNYYDSEAYNSLFDPETTYNDYNGFNR